MGRVIFFFQAEDGIRDKLVTGVQTCALPISAAQLGGGEEPALGEAPALDLHVMVVRAEDGHELGVDARVLHLLEQLDPGSRVADVGQAGDRFGLHRLDHGADPHLPGQRIRVERRRGPEPQDVEGGRPRDLDRVDDLVADALHDRRHRHHGGDPDHDAEDGERGAQLVGAELFDGDEPALGDGVQPHSYLNATTGSSFAARMAGYTPKITPTLAPRPSATATDHRVTRAGRGEIRLTTHASATPPQSPTTAPSAARVTDSARNWLRMSLRRAPSDLRMPISRVRSFTLISMMFMITIPPTMIPIATTAGMTVKSSRVRFFQKLTSASAVDRKSTRLNSSH